jgi:site-specific DNA-methyltransferase (adenine-specific)/adenine-specific DNA-methyltransferase
MHKFSEEDINHISRLLRGGMPLPASYLSEICETSGLTPISSKKEYELYYAEKEREQDILADTLTVPLQKIKSFRREDDKDNWSNMLILGDNLQILKTLLIMKEEGQLKNSDGTSGIRLIYIDPPFGTGDEYAITNGASAYSAKVIGARFIEFLRQRLIFLRELLSIDGSIYVRLDYHFGHYMKVIMDEIFGAQNFQNEIVINRFKRQLRGLNQFNVATDSFFLYTKSNDAFFREILRSRICSFCGCAKEPEWIPMSSPGLRDPPERTILGRKMLPPRGRHFTYTQDRIDQMTLHDRIRIDPETSYTDLEGTKVVGMPEYLQTEEIPADSNWTDLKGYQRSARYPTENPEELLERVVRASSRDDDLVLDCFAGSGTTLAVAEKLNRRWIGVDCGKLAVYVTQKRLLNIADSKDLNNPKRKYQKSYKPFDLYYAGLYDYSLIKKLPWEQYRNFALKLFQCRDEKHTISKIDLDGYLGADHVLVFDYHKHPDAMLTKAFIDDIDRILRDRIGRRFFIIAPAASVQFLEDYVEKDKTNYFVLRIPYSIIEEIHNKGFTKLKQPISEADVNNTVDAVGFDFIHIPDVLCQYFFADKIGQTRIGEGMKDCVIRIKHFKTTTICRTPVEFSNFETLSMVMLDYNFDGTVFDLDSVFFAADLKKQDYEIRFSPEKLKGESMIIYVDIFGNEKREVKKLSDFGNDVAIGYA